MKKGLRALLCATLSAAIMVGISAKCFAETTTVGEVTTKPAIDATLKTSAVVTDPEEIKKLLEKYELPQGDDGEVVSITICDLVYPPQDEPAPASDFLNPGEYEMQITYHTRDKRGKLIRSSQYDYPSGKMTIQESVQATFTTTAGISAEFISASVGFDVTTYYSVTDEQTVEVPYGKKCDCDAYVRLDYYEFKIIERDIWFDDDCGTGTASKPIGVFFVTTVR